MSEIASVLTPSFFVWAGVTLAAYLGARELQIRFNGTPLLNPVLVAATPIVLWMVITGTPHDQYAPAGRFWVWFLGPATVALAVPFYANFQKVKAMLVPIAIALAAGSATAAGTAVLIGWALGGEEATLMALAPKSVTTPIAMGISDVIGGPAVLAAAFVIITGIIGAALGGPFFDLIGVKDERARGFAMGVAAHGIGTARAFQVSAVMGTFSGVAMTLNGIATALLLPLIVSLF